MSDLKELFEETQKQAELIRHFKNLFGYTRSSVQEAIDGIRRDSAVLNEGEKEPTKLQKMLLERADDMQESLDAIEDGLS